MLGNLEPEDGFENQQRAADRLLGALPGIINYWYRFSHEGVRIETDTDAESLAGHFLQTLTGEKPSELHERIMDISLILYAEHEFNASTFTARVCASTLSDMPAKGLRRRLAVRDTRAATAPLAEGEANVNV